MKKLFITDLDGTALGGGFMPYNRFPDHFSDFLDELSSQGWSWAINTTWDPEGQWELVQRSKVKFRPAFLIAEFGRQLVEPRNDKLVRINPYTQENNARIADYCRDFLLPLLHSLFKRIAPKQVFYYEHLVSVVFHEDINSEDFPELTEAENSGVFFLRIAERNIVIRPKFLGKGLPMKILRTEFGFMPENIVCAGDEAADLAMMLPEYSKVYLAPANAQEAVKKYLKENGGFIGKREFAWGVIDAFSEYQKSNQQKAQT